MKPLEAVITGPSTRDGYFFAALSVSSTVVEGVSIYRVNLPTGSKVTVVQCGQLDRGAEFGFALTSRGLAGVAQISPQGLPQIYDEAPYTSAAAWIGYTAGQRRMIYSRGQVSAASASSVTVTMREGPYAGRAMSCPVAANVGLSASDFSVDDVVLLRWHPERQPVIAGWWDFDTELATWGLIKVYPAGSISGIPRHAIQLFELSSTGTKTAISDAMSTEAFEGGPFTGTYLVCHPAGVYASPGNEAVRQSFSGETIYSPTTAAADFFHANGAFLMATAIPFASEVSSYAVQIDFSYTVYVAVPLALFGAYVPFVSWPGLENNLWDRWDQTGSPAVQQGLIIGRAV